ncbi:hypothetical protein EJ05DRAFT_500622 [Pseudovirgaria hyperparasitica]|uniref:Uncharacterized protein n=1 Tax=Pseudovirgaria hyperparasitica TaxID=470096 RepID=A0A6A6W7V6_9PEZI|nr:uncharacterized protein EJ05DRAFT_500622 [Pseudovirgaria hyperparasitica]KAF2758104.1 hypothetical protein EJ05DRAFT_500622 [Pseudovirgaria hyperparasitica]
MRSYFRLSGLASSSSKWPYVTTPVHTHNPGRLKSSSSYSLQTSSFTGDSSSRQVFSRDSASVDGLVSCTRSKGRDNHQHHAGETRHLIKPHVRSERKLRTPSDPVLSLGTKSASQHDLKLQRQTTAKSAPKPDYKDQNKCAKQRDQKDSGSPVVVKAASNSSPRTISFVAGSRKERDAQFAKLQDVKTKSALKPDHEAGNRPDLQNPPLSRAKRKRPTPTSITESVLQKHGVHLYTLAPKCKTDLSFRNPRSLERHGAVDTIAEFKSSALYGTRLQDVLSRFLDRTGRISSRRCESTTAEQYVTQQDWHAKSRAWIHTVQSLDHKLVGVEARTMAAQGFNQDDLRHWAVIVLEKVNTATELLTSEKRIPTFLMLLYLKRSHIPPSCLENFLNLLSALVNRSLHEKKDTVLKEIQSARFFVLVAVRLLRHARQNDIRMLELVVQLILSTYGNVIQEHVRQHKQRVEEAAKVSHIFNTILHLVGLPGKHYSGTGGRASAQARLQFDILHYMNGFEPPLLVSERGYHGLVRVQVDQNKTEPERKWASLKAKSWPPWKADKTGLDAFITPEHGISRSNQVIRWMQQAGYPIPPWARAALIYSGWDTDGSPTIQTRAILPELGHMVQKLREDTMIWMARIQSTRTLNESWACFLAYEQSIRQQAEDTRRKLNECAAEIQTLKTKIMEFEESESLDNWIDKATDKKSRERGLEYDAMKTVLRAWEAKQLELEDWKANARNDIYFAMFKMLFQARMDSRYYGINDELSDSILPGDTPVVAPEPTSPYERIHVERAAPSVETFLEEMKVEGIRPTGRFLSFLLRYAPHLEFAKAVVAIGNGTHIRAVRTYFENPNHQMGRWIARKPDLLLGYVRMLMGGLHTDSTTWAELKGPTVKLSALPELAANENSLYDHLQNILYTPQAFARFHVIVNALLFHALAHDSLWSVVFDAIYRARERKRVKTSAIAQNPYILSFDYVRHIVQQLEEKHVTLGPQSFKVLCICALQAALATAEHTYYPPEDVQHRHRDIALFLRAQFLVMVSRVNMRDLGDPSQDTSRSILLRTPSPRILHHYVRALGALHDVEGIFSLVSFMEWHKDDLQGYTEDIVSGSRDFAKLIVAIRVCIERSWRPQNPSNTEANETLTLLIKQKIESIPQWGGWPDDEQVKLYCGQFCTNDHWKRV